MGMTAVNNRKLALWTAASALLLSANTAYAAESCSYRPPIEIDNGNGDEVFNELPLATTAKGEVPSHFSMECLGQGGGTGQIGLAVTGNVGGNIVSQIGNQAIESNAAIGGGAPGYNATPISMFLISGVNKLSHDGYGMTMGGTPFGRTAEYDELDAGFTFGLRLDGSKSLGLAPNTLTFGVFGNYTRTDIDLGAMAGYPKSGKVDVDSWSVGGYGLLTDGWKYGMVTVSGTFGSPNTEDFVYGSTSEFKTVGISTSAATGVLIPVGGAKLDLRGGLTYITVSGDDHTDSLGLHYTDAKLEDLSGSVSARLFGVMRTDGGVLRPFVQGGLNQRFHYKSEVSVEGTPFTFNDGDTTLFARAGVDFDLSRSTQAYISVRGDQGEDVQAISGQVGMTIKLD